MPALLSLPFIILLLSIALLPNLVPEWWEKNYYYISIILSLGIIVYYLIDERFSSVLTSSEDFIMFISLLLSVFVITGGIVIDIKGLATPYRNVILLFIGILISNIVGTTGASMLLIRPFIRTNRIRISPYHIIFFIILVSNIGGLLTPIGSPPLFIGYLKGIPFFWVTSRLFLPWILAVTLLLSIFYFIDRKNFKKQSEKAEKKEIEAREKIKIKGFFNIFLLFVVVISVFITTTIFLREIIMLTAAILSYKSTSKDIYTRNNFNFAPMREIAVLFFGIFITLIPVLELLSASGGKLINATPSLFYWLSGILSAFLDNAPTYLTFLSSSMGLFDFSVNNPSHVSAFLVLHPDFVIAISIASVMFGSMTYIGNAPNFIVKSIAEHQGVKTKSFFGYILKYSLPILFPIFILIWLLFVL
ncbi:MAG: sodium:proton antiporter [Ignavibacteria bacterium]